MDKKDIFKGIYEDFFGIQNIDKKNEQLAKEIEELTGNNFLNTDNVPIIEIASKDISLENKTSSSNQLSKEDKDEFMKSLLDEIDELYIDNSSKDLLKKIIEYMRKYYEKIEKTYIPFNLCIYSTNQETISKIVNILHQAGNTFSYIKQGQGAFYSFYDVEEASQIIEAYNNKNCLIIFKDLESIISNDQSYQNKLFNKFEEALSKNVNNTITILTSKNKEILQNSFSNSSDLLKKYFEFEIFEIKPDIQDLYQEVLEKLKDNIDVTEQIEIELLDYISNTYPNSTLPYPEFRDKLCTKILFNKTVPEYEKEKSMDEIFAELNQLVGLQKVKDVLKDLVNLIELKNKTKDDLKLKNINLHMIFLGNPGTGKTTVARIVANILYNLKYIKQNKLLEVSSKDLVAEYVGQTGPKTSAVIQKAIGGVLFVDEAYSLASGKGQGNSFNDEAVATLIQAMENYRDELVVIFAGYTKEMQDFLNLNSGIASRIGYTIEFEDYKTEELLKIFTQMMEKSGFIVTKDALKEVEKVINEYRDTKNFGNARFVRNIYEKSIIKHASNTKNTKNKKTLKTISKEDISVENLLKM